MDKDHLEILREDIRGKFDLVLEGDDALRKEIRDTREEQCEKIHLVDFKMGVLNRKSDDVQANLSQKIDGVETNLSGKIDAVAADPAAHRLDTAAHPSLYKVKEGN